MINVFLDTNILHEDYFFEKKTNKQILKYAQEGLINLYISDIVILEMKRHYEKYCEKNIIVLDRIFNDSKKLKIKMKPFLIDVESQLREFDKFYEKFLFHDNIHIINYKNDYLPLLIKMAIYKKKPFTETKSEPKDAIIWISYADYAETNNLENCIFLTANHHDFCDKKDKSRIHKELEIYSKRFCVIKDPFHFIKKYSGKIESPEHIFEVFFSSLEITEDYVKDVIEDKFKKQIQKYTHKEINKTSVSKILPDNDFLDDAQIIGYDIEILGCTNIESEITGNRAIISGVTYTSCEIEILQYNANRDKGEDNYVFEAEKTLIFKIYFNFDLTQDNQNEGFEDFEITDIELDKSL